MLNAEENNGLARGALARPSPGNLAVGTFLPSPFPTPIKRLSNVPKLSLLSSTKIFFLWSCSDISGTMFPGMSRHVHKTEESNDLHSYAPLDDVDDVDEKEVDDLGSDHEDIPLDSPEPPVVADRSYDRLKKALYPLQLLVPSFLRKNSDEPKKLHSTAWLGRCNCLIFLVTTT